MTTLRNFPIKRKVLVVTLLVAAVGLILTGGALLAFQVYSFRDTFPKDLEADGSIIASHTIGPLALKDPVAAAEMLGALKAKPYISEAQLRLPGGELFARSGRDSAWVPGAGLGLDRIGPYFVYSQSLVLDGDLLGTLYLRADYQTALSHLLRIYAIVLGVVLTVSIGLSALLSSQLQRVISEPILSLAHTARTIAAKKDYSLRATKLEDDEIGQFTDAFNEMLAEIQHATREKEESQELARLQAQLVDASRHAGRAEIATGVLHNVGNVLNSVNVSVTIACDLIRNSAITMLPKVSELLREHEGDLAGFFTVNPKGRLLPKCIHELSEHILREHKETMLELQGLAKNVEHIKEIVAMQQSYARVAGVIETVNPAELVNDALLLNAEGLKRREIEVIREVGNVPRVAVDRHKALQILINLLRNATDAMAENPAQHKQQIRIAVTHREPGSIHLSITDNGVGICAENLTKIFSHGFTTKRNGHGFGLHSGANAAREMGGKLSATSPGLGQGATFTLELPRAKPADPSVRRERPAGQF